MLISSYGWAGRVSHCPLFGVLVALTLELSVVDRLERSRELLGIYFFMT